MTRTSVTTVLNRHPYVSRAVYVLKDHGDCTKRGMGDRWKYKKETIQNGKIRSNYQITDLNMQLLQSDMVVVTCIKPTLAPELALLSGWAIILLIVSCTRPGNFNYVFIFCIICAAWYRSIRIFQGSKTAGMISIGHRPGFQTMPILWLKVFIILRYLSKQCYGYQILSGSFWISGKTKQWKNDIHMKHFFSLSPHPRSVTFISKLYLNHLSPV